MFKNATFYRFLPALGMDILCRLHDALKLLPLRELEPSQMTTAGFEGDAWIGMPCYVTIAFRSRVITPASIAEILDERIKKREHSEGRRIGGKERRRMKDEVIVDLMPHAPIITKRTTCLLHTGENWLAIDTASPRVAENCIGMLRQALGSFPALPLAPRVPVVAFLTAFLSTPDDSRGWALGDKCKLVSADGSAATYAHQELVGEEIQGNLNDGKLVSQLGIVMRGTFAATITADLVLKSIKFLDGADIHDAEDAVQVSMLQALEFERVARDLFSIFQCETPA